MSFSLSTKRLRKKKHTTMKNARFLRALQAFLVIYLKGLLMGIADIIPGVSGGTIAFITGIYERLVFGIRNVRFSWIWYLVRGKKLRAIRDLKRIDFALFIPLLAGIATAFLIFAELIRFFLTIYPSYTYAFFFGLILSSAYLIATHIDHLRISAGISFLLGLLGAYFFVGIASLQTNHSLLTIFISAALAICAMILPGISGAFLLLMLGQYQYLLDALHRLDLLIITTFILGAGIGLLSFAHLVAYFLKKHKMHTLTFLIGLMLGALRQPYENIVRNEFSGILVLISALVGFALVFFIERMSADQKSVTR